jgi:hypothetical protein
MPVEVVGAQPPSGQPPSGHGYGSAGDWFRAVKCLEHASSYGDLDASCGQVARFLDAWESANGGPPWVADGARRMSSWPAFCGGCEQFAAVGGVGERKLTAHAVREGWYTAVGIEGYSDL